MTTDRYVSIAIRTTVTENGRRVVRESDVSGVYHADLDDAACRMLRSLTRPVSDADRDRPDPAPLPDLDAAIDLDALRPAYAAALASVDGSVGALAEWESSNFEGDEEGGYAPEVAVWMRAALSAAPALVERLRAADAERVEQTAELAHCHAEVDARGERITTLEASLAESDAANVAVSGRIHAALARIATLEVALDEACDIADDAADTIEDETDDPGCEDIRESIDRLRAIRAGKAAT